MVAKAAGNNHHGGATDTAAEKIDGHTIEKLLTIAEKNVSKKTVHSKILDPESEARIPKFDGTGKYCCSVMDDSFLLLL